MVRPDDPPEVLREQHPLPAGCQQRYYQEGDEEAMLACLNDAFGAWPRIEISVPAVEHLRWKLHMHPRATESHIIAHIGERIIAVRPLWAHNIQIDGRLFLARQAVDRGVVQDYQKAGVMSGLEVRMPATWHERFECTYSLRVGWQRINLTPGKNYIRSIDVVARPLDLSGQLAVPGDFSLRQIESFDERMDAFWAGACKPYRVIVARTKERLNYRFADPRAGVYRIVVAERGDSVLGYLITASRGETGVVADALVLPDKYDVLEALIEDAAKHLRLRGKTSLEFWRFPYHPYVATLEKAGFKEPRRTQGVNLRSLQERDDDFSFFSDQSQPAHYAPGDSDIV